MGLKFRNDLTAEEVRRQFSYDPEAGTLTRIAGGRGWSRVFGGTPCGRRYPRVRVGRGVYALHRIIWLHVTGTWPDEVIDHINGDPSDNRLCNLRSVSQIVNSQNQRRAMRTSKTGLLGAFPNRDRFQAQITVDGRIRHIGVFDTAQEAHSAYVQAKRALHEGCTI